MNQYNSADTVSDSVLATTLLFGTLAVVAFCGWLLLTGGR